MQVMGPVGMLKDRAVEDSLLIEEDFARLLKRKPASLADAVQRRRLFFIERAGRRYYPAFFVDASLRRRKLYDVSAVLGALSGGSKLQFFCTPKGSLNAITPLDALRRGMVAEVKRAALGFAER